MPLDKGESLARELLSAYETGQAIPIIPSARPGFDLNMAYEVEATLKRLREDEGHKAVGRKVGFANKAMWRVLKLETLLWAHMYDDTVYYSKDCSASLTLAHPRSLKIEPEIVFGLKQPVMEGSDAAAALASVDWLAIGFEIIHCPFPDWRFQPADFVAAFGLHLGLIVGEPIRIEPARIPALLEDLARFKVRIFKNGEFVEEGSGKNSLRSPALCLAELGRATPLGAGDLVSSGTLTAGHAMAKGEAWRVEVEGLPLSGFTLRTE